MAERKWLKNRSELPFNYNIVSQGFLNNLVAKSDSLSSNMFLETIKGPDTVPDIVSDPEELKNPTEPYSEDFGMQGLINQYRLQLGNQYSDAAIGQYIKLVNPAQYDAARNSGYQEVYEDRKDLKPSFTDVWSNTRATSSTVELANLKYGVPAIAILQKDKWLWYTGKLSQEEIQEKNWDYDPFNGLTILKSDYDKFFGADRDIQKAIEKMEYCKIVVEYLQDIVSQLTWRHQTIKNIIEWRRFMAGS